MCLVLHTTCAYVNSLVKLTFLSNFAKEKSTNGKSKFALLLAVHSKLLVCAAHEIYTK